MISYAPIILCFDDFKITLFWIFSKNQEIPRTIFRKIREFRRSEEKLSEIQRSRYVLQFCCRRKKINQGAGVHSAFCGLANKKKGLGRLRVRRQRQRTDSSALKR